MSINKGLILILMFLHLFLYPVIIDEDIIVIKIENSSSNLHFHHNDHFTSEINFIKVNIFNLFQKVEIIFTKSFNLNLFKNNIWRPPKLTS